MRSNQGSAMIVALIIVLIVIGISGAFLVETAYRSKHAFAGRESDEAQMICEAALEKTRLALYVYKTEGTYAWDRILADHAERSLAPEDHWADYVARRDGDDFARYRASYDQAGAGTLEDAPPPDDPGHFLGVTKPYGQGGFYVVIRDNDDGDADDLVDADHQLLVYVTASLPDGTQRQIEALVYWTPPMFVPDHAMLVDGRLTINGNPSVVGARGSVHSNNALDMSGNPLIEENATSAQELSVSGNPTVMGILDSGPQYSTPVPEVDVREFRLDATYVLGRDGSVRDASGARIGEGDWNGLKFTGREWSVSGNGVLPPGSYYVETDLKISGNPGSLQAPMTATFFVEGSAEVSGNPSISPFDADMTLLAAGDVKISGNPDAVYAGLIYAGGRLDLSGNPTMMGAIVVKNTGGGSGAQISGNPSIRYDGGIQTRIPGGGSVPIRAMRRLK